MPRKPKGRKLVLPKRPKPPTPYETKKARRAKEFEYTRGKLKLYERDIERREK